MSPSRVQVTAAIVGYNLVQNRLLPSSLYVPANILVSAALVANSRRAGCDWSELGLDPKKATGGVRSGLQAAGVIALATAAATHPAIRRRLLDQRAADQTATDILYHTLVRFPFGTALFEEVTFRGVVEAISRKDGATRREARSAAAVLFGLWHLVPTMDALGGTPVADGFETGWSRAGAVAAGAVASGVASFGFSWLRERSGSLVAPWLAHTAISCAGYSAGIAAWRRSGTG